MVGVLYTIYINKKLSFYQIKIVTYNLRFKSEHLKNRILSISLGGFLSRVDNKERNKRSVYTPCDLHEELLLVRYS